MIPLYLTHFAVPLLQHALGAQCHGHPTANRTIGTLLCQAYEAYLELHAPVSISFEHAWFLLLALARRDEVGMARCEDCGGLGLRELLDRHEQTCGNCRQGSPGLTH